MGFCCSDDKAKEGHLITEVTNCTKKAPKKEEHEAPRTEHASNGESRTVTYTSSAHGTPEITKTSTAHYTPSTDYKPSSYEPSSSTHTSTTYSESTSAYKPDSHTSTYVKSEYKPYVKTEYVPGQHKSANRD